MSPQCHYHQRGRSLCRAAAIHPYNSNYIWQDVRDQILEIIAWSFRCLGGMHAHTDRDRTCIHVSCMHACTRPHCHYHMMFMHVTYMHEHPSRGRWPRRDPFGNEWPPGYRKNQAGLALAGDWRAVFAGVQGDQDWFHKIFYFKRDLFAQQLINDIFRYINK